MRHGLRRDGLAVLLLLCGCARGPDVSWPAAPDREIGQADGQGRLLAYDLDRDGRVDYLQRLQDGYKTELLFAPQRGEGGWARVPRGPHAPRRPLLVILLDGVSFDRIHNLYERGRFRLFRRPTRVISTFPSLTDVAFDAFFGTGPTPGYEAAHFDRGVNRLSDGVSVYLQGGNERWVSFVQYRMHFMRDALMYLMPQSTFAAELRAARRVVDRELAAGRREVVVYLLSTDGLGHMVPVERFEQRLAELDDWIERVVYAWRGELDLVMLADHGNTTHPPRRFDVVAALTAGGLRVRDRLQQSGDVATPVFGLLDLARVHTYDDATRDRVVDLLRGRAEVELLAARDGEAVRVWTDEGEARIEARGTSGAREYRMTAVSGNPLNLRAVESLLDADADGFASAAAWLAATERDTFPAGAPRLWDGMLAGSQERPEVVASLREDWFVGSGFFTKMTKLRGTHGGLARRSSETFVMTSRGELDVTLLIAELSDALRRMIGWPPGASPATGPETRENVGGDAGQSDGVTIDYVGEGLSR